ncbi:MAG: low molecular weight protein-tyrosine-phosphatase [Cyanobacteria bacterium J06626_23]
MTSPEKTRLLFVCLGNICRSPTAENVTRHLLQARTGPVSAATVLCDSAGTSGYHVGAPPDRRMRQAAQRRGLSLTGRSRQFEVADFEQFDWILAMDRSNQRDILAVAPSGQYRDRVRLMCEFCRQYPDTDVPDPYYGGADGFDYVFDLLTDACGGFLDFLDREIS